jgi:hypothetical protein
MRALALVAALVAGGCSSDKTCEDYQEGDACDPQHAPTCYHAPDSCRCWPSGANGLWGCEELFPRDMAMRMDLAPPRDLASLD